MKKSFISLIIGILFILTGCDNNKGPFQIKNENGMKVLYSGKKPAKGWVENNIYNYNGESTKVYEIYFEDGLPAGDFKLFDTEGNLVVNAEGKLKNGLFEGKIDEKYGNTKAKGTFSINQNFLINFDGEGYEDFSQKTLIDGKYKGDYGIFTMKNNKLDGKYKSYHKNGALYEECTYKNGILDGKYISYYKDGSLCKESTYKDGILDGKYRSYYEDGSLYEESTYKNGEHDGEYTIAEKITRGKRVTKGVYTDGRFDGKAFFYDEKLQDGKKTYVLYREQEVRYKEENGLITYLP